MAKNRIFILGLISIAIFFQSCLKDEETYSLAIGTTKLIEGNRYYFDIDDNEKMLPNDTSSIQDYKAIDGQRAFIYFSLLDKKISGYDYNAKVIHIENILTKNIIPLTEETADSIGDDRINITNMWLGGEHLNIEFQLMGTLSSQKPHMVNLVQKQMATNNNIDEYIELEFRHNAHNDPPNQLRNGIVSFRLKNINVNNYKGIKIRTNTIYDGIKYYTINFTHNPQIIKKNKGILNRQIY